jgi:hypothetical protein
MGRPLARLGPLADPSKPPVFDAGQSGQLGGATKTQPEPLSARRVEKVGFDEDQSLPIARMAEIRKSALLAIKPYAHGSERCGQTGLLNCDLDRQHGRSVVCIRRKRSHLPATGAGNIRQRRRLHRIV